MYQVQIYYQPPARVKTKKWIFICTGAIISTQVILIAAHCVTGTIDKYAIMAGEKTCQNQKISNPFLWIEIDRSAIRVHPLYEGLEPFDFNVALIKARIHILKIHFSETFT